MSVVWGQWETLISNGSVAAESIVYTGEVETSGSAAIEIHVEAIITRPGNLSLALYGAGLSTLSEAVQQFNGPRFFSRSGSIGFTLKSEDLSTFNLRVQSKFATAISLEVKIRKGVSSGDGGGASAADTLASLLAIQSNTAAIKTQTDGLELSSESISLNANQINLNTDEVEALLGQINANLIDSTMSPQVAFAEWHLGISESSQPLAPPGATAQSVLLAGVKADGNPNDDVVRLGVEMGPLNFRLYPGTERTISAPENAFFDLSQILVQGRDGDGLSVWIMYYGTPPT